MGAAHGAPAQKDPEHPHPSTGGSPGSLHGLSDTPAPDVGPPLEWVGSVFTGLEPVAMIEHPVADHRLFVVNHVSDDVAVVDLDELQVTAVIPVGDEPQGIAVYGGRLFVACARAPKVPPQLGQLDPGAFDSNVVVVVQDSPPFAWVKNVSIGALSPRALAVAGDRVFAMPLHSGNHTTLLNENFTVPLGMAQTVPDALGGGPFAINPILLKPELNPSNFARGWYVPNAGRIVFDSEFPQVPQLQDADVVALDGPTASLLPGAAHGVGTTLFDLAVNPVSGDLWISGTDAGNRVRFEKRLRGNAISNRVAIVSPTLQLKQVFDLAIAGSPDAMAEPGAIHFFESPELHLALVCAVGSGRVAVFDSARAKLLRQIVTGPLPMGVTSAPRQGRIYVHCRGEQAIRVYDAFNRFAQVGDPVRFPYDPEPAIVQRGRLHLYDARVASGHGNGTMSCASCHVFGHDDQLAWDLGDPEGGFGNYYPDVLTGLLSYPGQIVTLPTTPVNHPLKGPMVTQSLRGLFDPDTKDDMPLHWRGDRRTFQQFRAAFRKLLGGSGVAMGEVQEFAGFLRHLRYAPNPFEPKDQIYLGADLAGANTYGMNAMLHGKEYTAGTGVSCIDCHKGNFFTKSDFTGSRPVASAGSFTQLFQTAQLRAIYEKDFKDVAGFGLLHDGAVDGVRGFMDFNIPNGGPPTFSNFSTAEKDQVADFVKHWDTGLSPLVGAQFTMDAATFAVADAFLDLAEAQAKAPASNVDLILKGFRLDVATGEKLPRGAVFEQDGATWGYRFDTGDFADRALVKTLAQVGIGVFTFTCVPPGTGRRLGIDRDEDGAFDFVEVVQKTSPVDCDSDGDGYLDGFEIAIGANPHLQDQTLPDAAPPHVLSVRALEISDRAATVAVVTDEPTTATLALGTAAGLSDVATIHDKELARRRDLMALDLPSGATIHYTLTLKDRNGNAAVQAGSFQTLPPFFHVKAIALFKVGAGPFSISAKVDVVDANDQPVEGMPVTVFFAGDIGGQTWQRVGVTDGTGAAVIGLNPFTPAAPTTVAVSPAYLGSLDPSHPFFVGKGGDTPSYFYDQPENVTNYATIAVP